MMCNFRNVIAATLAILGQAVLAACLTAGIGAGACANELLISSGGPAAAIFQKWAEEYTATTGVQVKFTFGTVANVQGKVAAGEPADLVFLAAEAMDALERDGKIRKESRVKLGRVGLGIASKAGGVKPDIATPDTLRNALLAAPVVVYPDAKKTVTGRLFAGILRELGIADVIAQKGRQFSGATAVMKSLAQGSGEELAAAPMTTIAAARSKGVQLVGAVPPPLQQYAYYEAGIASNAKSPEAASAALQSLISAVGLSHFVAGGFDVDR